MAAGVNGILLPAMEQFPQLKTIEALLSNETKREIWFNTQRLSYDPINETPKELERVESTGNSEMPLFQTILDVFETHDQAIWDETVTKNREQHLLKTTNRSGERLFSLVKRLLDDNQRIRAELMTAKEERD